MPPAVLFAIPNVPHPLVSGGHLRDWQILNLLNSIGIRPHVLYFGAGEKYQLDQASPLHALVSSITFGGHRVENPDSGVIDAARRKLGYLVNSSPRTSPYSYQYDEIKAGNIIKETAQKTKAEVVVLRNMWCHYIEDLAPLGCKVVINCPDLNTLLARQLVRAVPGPLRKAGPICNYVAVRRQEHRFFPRCDEIWIPTISEAKEVSRFASHVERLILPNLVDVSRLPDLSARPCVSPNCLLFVANFAYLPNANGAKRLLEKIIPKLRQRKPDVEL